MPVLVRIPTPLRALTKGNAEIQAKGDTIDSLVSDLERQYPGLKDRLLDESGELRRFINIYVNQEDIRFLQAKKTTLKDGDEVSRAGDRRRVAGAVVAMARMRIRLTFPAALIQEPIVYRLVKDFDIVINIRRADVKADHGWMALELEGGEAALERGIKWLKDKGVQVDPIERDVIVP